MSEQGKNKKNRIRLGPKTALLVWILIFCLPGLIFPKNSFFPGPKQVFDSLGRIVAGGDFLTRSLYTAVNVLSGFFIGSVLGVLFGMMSDKSESFENFLKVPLSLIKSVPVASFIILSLFWFTQRGVSIFVVFLIVFPVVYGHALSAWKSLDPKMEEMAQVFAVKPVTYFRAIVMDHIKDDLAEGFKTGIGMAWKAGVAAEVISMAGKSIGGAIYDAKVYLEMADLFAWTLWLVVMSVMSEKLIGLMWTGIQKILARIPAGAPGPFVDQVDHGKAAELGASWGQEDPVLLEGHGKPEDVPGREPGDGSDVDHGKPGPPRSPEGQEDPGKAGEGPGRGPAGKPLLIMENVNFFYPEKLILKDFNLSLKAGDRLAITGRSGIGKTSLLRIIAGLEDACAGRVIRRTEGQNDKAFGPSVSMQFQEDRLIENAGILENLRLVGCSDSEIRAAAKALDLEGFGDGPVKGMSGGMKRRLSLMRAVLKPSDLVVLDEPLAGMDEKTAEKAMAWAVKEIGRRHLACIIASHDLDGIKGFNINSNIELMPSDPGPSASPGQGPS